jgi:hypothetical protein
MMTGYNFSIRTAAKIAGFGLLFMFLSGFFASVADTSKLYETSISSLSKLRVNIVGDLMMLVFDVVAAVGFFYLLAPVNTIFSMLAAWFRLMHVAVYGAAILNLLWVAYLLSGGEGSTPFGTEPSEEQIMFFLKGHEFGFKMGLVFFGFHFLVLGYLVYKSGYIPKILGIFLIILGVGYLVNSLSSFLMPNYDDYQTIMQQIIFIPAIIGELSLCLWLLFRGNTIPEV